MFNFNEFASSWTNINFCAFKDYVHDIEGLDINEICFEEKKSKTVNLILFLGIMGNIDDANHVWSNLRRSLDSEDILIVSDKLDKNQNRTDFTGPKNHQNILLWIPEILGFDIKNPKLHFVFDELKQARCVYLELEKDYILTIDKSIINLKKGIIIVEYTYFANK